MELPKQPIDHRFHSTETKAPFASCMVCSKALLQDDGDYFIEKIFRNVPALDLTELIFEYALCMGCVESLRNELSKASKEAIQQYFENTLKERGLPAESDRYTTCLLTGDDIRSSGEFSMHAHCQGSQMVLSLFPYVISSQAMDEIGNLLSNETLDQLEGFKDRFFTGPPEFSELLNPRRLLIL